MAFFTSETAGEDEGIVAFVFDADTEPGLEGEIKWPVRKPLTKERPSLVTDWQSS
jgi:hypothetical protein